MDSPTIVPPLAGQVLGSQDNSFVIAEWQDAGAPPGPPRWIAPKHVHHKDDEAWYVLEGVLGVLVGDKEVEARTGAAVMVPRGTPHTYWNAGAGRLRYLLVMTANIHQLIQDIHALKEKTPATLKEVFRKHDSELL
jgi:mannose-6-phosphate isomerase-like protein (cupin superfamily)